MILLSFRGAAARRARNPCPEDGFRARSLRSRPGMTLLQAVVLFWLAAPAHAQDRLAVVTHTTDLASLAEAVGGERVAVTSLVPPAFDPEEYQPKPQDVARVKNARLLVRVGLDFDLWFDRLLAQAGVTRGSPSYVDASTAIAALEVRGLSVGPGDGH